MSANDFIDILIPSKIKNLFFVLSSIGIIYLFNYKNGEFISKFQSLIPLIKDSKSKLLTDISNSLLLHVFSYGRIIVWDLKKSESMLVNLKHTKTNNHYH